MQIQTGVMSTLLPSSQPLSDGQKQSLNDVISKYDASDLSDEDAKSLVSEISDLGVEQGSDLATALTDAGFDPKGLAEQAGIGRQDGPPPPPPPNAGQGAKGPESESVQTLLSIVEDLRASTEESGTQSDFGALLTEALADAGYDTSSPIVDFRA